MPATINEMNCVAVGSWNPVIVTPLWLQQNKVVTDLPDAMSFFVHGTGRKLRFELGGASWHIDEDRLQIATTKPGVDCGALASRILRLLVHTPVSAYGTNFAFTCPRAEWPANVPFALESVPVRVGDTEHRVSNFGASGTVGLGSRKNIQIAITVPDAKNVLLALNVHRGVESAAAAADECDRWGEDCALVKSLVEATFGMETEWP